MPSLWIVEKRLIESIAIVYGSKTVSEYDQEIPQSQNADNPWHR